MGSCFVGMAFRGCPVCVETLGVCVRAWRVVLRLALVAYLEAVVVALGYVLCSGNVLVVRGWCRCACAVRTAGTALCL